ncbi:MAG: NADAR family protein [Chlorobium sp.]|nr:NADAR family protein [Chlorobium sp.]
MNISKNSSDNMQTRTYYRTDCIVFKKTKETFGGLSNMAGGFPIKINDISILTAEALYQACRFPRLPDVQELIITQKSPMAAKMVGKPYRKDSRPDWDTVRVKIMSWCLRVKLACNWYEFGELLHATGDKPIVEDSRKDRFWGAVAEDDEILVGNNVLGRLLMKLREELKSEDIDDLKIVKPLLIDEFLLYHKSFPTIHADLEVKVKLNDHRQYDLF